MAKQSRYSIEIKDDTGKKVIFAVKWTVDERRLAVAQMRRLVEQKASPLRPQGIEGRASLRHGRQHVTGPGHRPLARDA
jgi:hypothetical protein